jgi:hypothetical protein
MDQAKCQIPKFGPDQPLSKLLTQHLQGFLEYSPDGMHYIYASFYI